MAVSDDAERAASALLRRRSCSALLLGAPARRSCSALLLGAPARRSCSALLLGGRIEATSLIPPEGKRLIVRAKAVGDCKREPPSLAEQVAIRLKQSTDDHILEQAEERMAVKYWSWIPRAVAFFRVWWRIRCRNAPPPPSRD